jgi:hypothetical protein
LKFRPNINYTRREAGDMLLVIRSHSADGTIDQRALLLQAKVVKTAGEWLNASGRGSKAQHFLYSKWPEFECQWPPKRRLKLSQALAKKGAKFLLIPHHRVRLPPQAGSASARFNASLWSRGATAQATGDRSFAYHRGFDIEFGNLIDGVGGAPFDPHGSSGWDRLIRDLLLRARTGTRAVPVRTFGSASAVARMIVPAIALPSRVDSAFTDDGMAVLVIESGHGDFVPLGINGRAHEGDLG